VYRVPGSADKCSGASTVLFFLFATFLFEVYYLSLAFQAVYNNSATIAGVKLLPLIMVQIIILIASSRIIPRIGRFKWVIVAGPIFLAIGSGALYTVKYGTPESRLYGFEVLLGVGIGLAMQNSMLAVQFELKKEPWLISAGTGVAVFSESSATLVTVLTLQLASLGVSSVFLSVARSLVILSRRTSPSTPRISPHNTLRHSSTTLPPYGASFRSNTARARS
jgi:hypothetical protein